MIGEEGFKIILLLLSTALGLSFLIERLLEVVNGAFKKMAFSRPGRFTQELPPAVSQPQDPLDSQEAGLEEQHRPVLFAVKTLEAKNPIETTQVLLLQLIGLGAGILICLLADFGLFGPLQVFNNISDTADHVLTGILIGGGSQPIHFLIQFLNQRKVIVDGPPNVLPIVQPAGVIVDLDDEPDPFFKILDVPYSGGYRPESLEHRNLRAASPDLIVYHHTAMHSNAKFEDVVREIVEVKGWSTGYHSVIGTDGTIHNFCRWDRTGVHALGVNHRSLGVALMGNFHTETGDPFSNFDGRFGNMRPTDIQLLAAARVVALWCHLYNLEPKFGETIVSHREVRATACSGSNFPYAAFEEIVVGCYEDWKSHDAQKELVFYKQKQLIYSE